MTKRNLHGLLATSALLLGASQVQAAVFGGVEFPQGAISFADTVASYQPGLEGASPGTAWQGAQNALGAPNYTTASCASQAACQFVSLGVGGVVVLGFTDNVLTGSDSTADDLWIFEVGPDVEDTLVDISANGVDWFSVGKVFGSTRGVDIDAFGYGTSSSWSFVRLTDVASEGATSGATVGADIDAVGAISTRVSTGGGVPEPSTWAMMVLGFAGLGAALRRSRRREARLVGG